VLESSLARWIVLALRARLVDLEQEPDTNLGSIGWLLDRCDDTLGLTGDVDWGPAPRCAS
jgi:hypothetical protein